MKNAYEIRGEVTAIFLNYKGSTYETLIDTEDLPLAESYPNSWFMQYDSHTGGYYVTGRKRNRSVHLRYKLHRTIMKVAEGFRVVDHINHDTLDNRKSNLRVVSTAQNNQNKKLPSNNKSGTRGVHLEKDSGKYKAQITIDGRRKNLGRFDTLEEAKLVFETARKKHMPYSQEALAN